MPDNANDLLQIFKAEPTKLTKQELIELGKWIGGIKLTMKMKEATMIKKIETYIAESAVEVDETEIINEPSEVKETEISVDQTEISVEVKEAPKVVEKTDIVHTKLGMKALEPSKTYKLTRSQRSALKKHGESVSTIPHEMTGKELMTFPNWKVLGL